MAAAATVFALLWVTARAPRPQHDQTQSTRSPRPWARVAANLAPTVLLMSVFPLIASTFAVTTIGVGPQATPTLLVVLAVSVSVPWACGIVAAPFYPALAQVSRSNPEVFAAAFFRTWPVLAVWALVPVAVFTTAATLLQGWGAEAALFFALGLGSNVLLAQALVAIQELRFAGTQVAAWAGYAAALYAAPQLWWLAPLAGAVVCVLRLRGQVSNLSRPEPVDRALVLSAMRDGAWSSSVLWIDKFLLIAIFGVGVDVYTVYVALIPMVVAQSLYFGRLYDSFNAYQQRLQRLVATTPAAGLPARLGAMCRRIEYVVLGPVALAVVCAIAIVGLGPSLGLGLTGALAFVVLAPVGFLAVSLSAFQLTQLGGARQARLIYAAHVAATVVACVFLPFAAAYLVLIVVDGVLATWTLSLIRRRVRAAAFDMFWKEAVAW
ncbi:hypothetical protein C1Y63_06695 [Corynebacterium sp. 13CS0277]|nr:hypothetical protein C1Y63_06695 [Corynebacterium sp. 13CS0277]